MREAHFFISFQNGARKIEYFLSLSLSLSSFCLCYALLDSLMITLLEFQMRGRGENISSPQPSFPVCVVCLSHLRSSSEQNLSCLFDCSFSFLHCLFLLCLHTQLTLFPLLISLFPSFDYRFGKSLKIPWLTCWSTMS